MVSVEVAAVDVVSIDVAAVTVLSIDVAAVNVASCPCPPPFWSYTSHVAVVASLSVVVIVVGAASQSG